MDEERHSDRAGHYVLLGRLGEGGMGVVHRAHDSKLDRPVALKFLPREVGHAHGEEREKLLREARAAAAVNHPNVCVVHDVHDGDPPFIVMELVEGVTLRQRIAGEPLPLATALSWAIQIGDAIAAAHAKGVLHRDIKSENVMVTASGHVKVMDFGLAKLRAAGGATRTAAVTGTLAYLAPELIQGGMSDARTDVFSFGVLLYEMLAGQTPFRGEHHAAVLHSILHDEPKPIASVRGGTPPELDRIVERALAKRPENRYADVATMVDDLRRLKTALDLSDSQGRTLQTIDVGRAPRAGTTSAGRRPYPRAAIVGIAATAAFAVLAVAAWAWWSRRPPSFNPNPTVRVLETPVKTLGYTSMSSDGRWIAFPGVDDRGRWGVYFMNTRGGEVRRVEADSSYLINYLDLAPDGSRVAYSVTNPRRNAIELRVLSSLGGESRAIADSVALARWSPDGTHIAAIIQTDEGKQLWTMDADGGDRSFVLYEPKAVGGRSSLSYSPDGKQIAWLQSRPDGPQQEIVLVDLATKRIRPLTNDRANIDEVYWSKSGLIYYSSNRGGTTNIWAIRPSGGTPAQVTRGAGPDFSMRVSDDGKTLMYVQQQNDNHIRLSNTAHGEARTISVGSGSASSIAFSPDGERLVLVLRDADPLRARARLVTMDLEGERRATIGREAAMISNPVWPPGGDRLYALVADDAVLDSLRLVEYDLARPEEPARKFGRFSTAGWEDSLHLLLRRGAVQYRLGRFDGTIEQAGPESTLWLGRKRPAWRLREDRRAGREGLWMRVPGDGAEERATYTRILPFGPSLAISNRSDWIVVLEPDGSKTRIHLPSLRKESAGPGFADWGRNRVATISRDDARLAVVVPDFTSRLILVENLR